MLIRDIISVIERFAPLSLQEEWDNSGLQCGDASAECTGVMLCLDVTLDVIEEASARGCNLVVSHHPMIFRGIKRLTGATVAERCIVAAISHNMAVYSSHTALDSADGGVSHALAALLGARVSRVLHPMDAEMLRLTVYAPREKADANLDVYRGTADAISQNIDFIDTYSPEYILVLSGDHIYKMNYAKMLAEHKACNADATIAVIEVPFKEASRFGIMHTDEEGHIIEFQEKPENPKSNLASMGIYIFNWKPLRKLLVADMKDPDSHHDFGKDIIPRLLADNKTLYAYRFKGYWKDVGTIDSLWEANMDLLDSNNELDLNDPTWKIYTEDATTLPHYVGPEASIKRSFVTQGCIIEGEVKNSVLFTGVEVGEGAKIIDSVLMPGVKVEAGAVVQRALVADGVKIGKEAVVGSADSEHIELVAKRVKGVE